MSTIPAYIQLIGDGDRAEGFEEWLQASLEAVISPARLAGLSKTDREYYESRLRIMKILSTATVEACRIESQNGRPSEDLLFAVADGLAHSLASLVQLTYEERGHAEVGAIVGEHLQQSFKRIMAFEPEAA